MLTANRLLDGEVVYWAKGQWVTDFGGGEVLPTPKEAEAALAAAEAFVRDNQVVGVYLFEVRETAHGPEPVKEREILRSLGPSVRRDMGKQAHRTAETGSQKPEAGNRQRGSGTAGASYEI